MASRAPLECPVCRTVLEADQNLEDHLVAAHTKQRLARFVVAEAEVLTEQDVSE